MIQQGPSASLIREKSKWLDKIPQIQIDSPRTSEACRLLGLDSKDFQNKYKTFEDFTERGVPEDIQKLKFKHYKAKIQDHVQLIQKQRETMIIKSKKQILPYALSSYTGDHSTSYLSLGSQLFPTAQKPEEYCKAISYLRNNHKSPKIVDSFDIIPETNNGLTSYLEDQIEKYNRVKQQIQKEALGIYESDLHRLQQAQSLEEKMSKIDTVKSKFQESKVKRRIQPLNLGQIEERALGRINVKIRVKEME